MNAKLFFILFLLLSNACSTTPHDFNLVLNENKNKFQNNQVQKTYDELIVNSNNGCVDSKCPFYEESNYLNTWPPKIGLALSGGGTRSASFSIGVLKALYEIGILKKVNVISSVSGGSYAAYWYFSQKFYMDKVASVIPQAKYNEDDMFRTHLGTKSGLITKTNLDSPNSYRHQRTLEESSDILAFRHDDSLLSEIKIGLQYSAEYFIQTLSAPFHWVTNGIFDWEVNMMPFFYYYKDGLDRTYGYVPLDYKLEHFANARKRILTDNIDAEPILLSEMREFLEKEKEKEKLPYFIINTTGQFASEFNTLNKDRNMENTVFEFTPFGYYSALLGVNKYHNCPSDKKVMPYDCLLDFRIHEPSGYSNFDLATVVAISGAAVDSQAESVDVAGKTSEESNKFIFAQKSWWLDKLLYIPNLNMGYHIANPDTPRYRKLLHKLLPWPLYLVDDYSLGNQDSIYLSDGGHSENLGLYSLIRRGVKEIYVVDAEQDGKSVFEGAKRLNNTLEKYGLKLSFNQNEPESVFNANSFIINASIVSLDNTSNISIHYIKLAVPARHNQTVTELNKKLPFTVRSYMEKHPDFPHQSTADIFYSAEQFKAYRDLGYTLTMCGLGKCPEVD